MKYRKKPVEVEAFKFGVEEMPNWFITKINNGEVVIFNRDNELTDFQFCEIYTLEGVMVANKGDYIIRGVKGEIYPCKPDIFQQTYEPFNDSTQSDEKLIQQVIKDREEYDDMVFREFRNANQIKISDDNECEHLDLSELTTQDIEKTYKEQRERNKKLYNTLNNR